MINRCYANDNIKQPRAILVPDHKPNKILFYEKSRKTKSCGRYKGLKKVYETQINKVVKLTITP